MIALGRCMRWCRVHDVLNSVCISMFCGSREHIDTGTVPIKVAFSLASSTG